MGVGLKDGWREFQRLSPSSDQWARPWSGGGGRGEASPTLPLIPCRPWKTVQRRRRPPFPSPPAVTAQRHQHWRERRAASPGPIPLPRLLSLWRGRHVLGWVEEGAETRRVCARRSGIWRQRRRGGSRAGEATGAEDSKKGGAGEESKLVKGRGRSAP